LPEKDGAGLASHIMPMPFYAKSPLMRAFYFGGQSAEDLFSAATRGNPVLGCSCDYLWSLVNHL
jgi:hypothetical protein